MEELLRKIEELRRQMLQTAEERSLADPEVCRISQRLDHYINEYLKAVRTI
ncbi:aspartyl-phosphate phosphatase Spo0E family protein [Aneurinibacillus migulanus]|uniref:aspartyl-phosphate phosphatase Spo0E family protein n=1 Tax=Aneurinibacillus migulanus TaxID=47500 RepID=UPI0009BB1D26|nr:aspartyl-phosphate phosphatase Spo0E family protein [Aneurinibacillus migulanus]MCP1356144.1 aspartyl-phosphate phosphatase Spo0E family protein [Aneurinibacillus migulanus]MED0890829.1 aspartyl-phosphate phosphatase Spo0E family protein [Aneurinibacillus migulanus]MED1618437.1 aspartyl-phosphate phosphatase Spo0E family protein [Aneurinibacillus migulanus]MED4727116.1 aspartyl-phosphate phosphatase Spo0E family protein [Aneurinibacillus migulanus]GED14745.1 hypothetical protein AMI01nite_2